MQKIIEKIAEELSVKISQVESAINLLDQGDTVPFISRYRKEATGGLSDTQLRNLEERLIYLRELEERRETVLKSIQEQNKLTSSLKQEILNADTKTRLEDLYLPYKPKRRTKAQIAREAGLEPLAQALLADSTLSPEMISQSYINADKNINDSKSALEGARHILIEQFSESAELLNELREYCWQQGEMHAKVIQGKENEGHKFADYFDYKEVMQKIPSHRALALFRGRKEGFLLLQLKIDEPEHKEAFNYCEARIAQHTKISNLGRPADAWLHETVKWAWKIKLALHLETELFLRLRENAEEEAIKVFANNLRHLLLAAPAGPKITMGLDPGLRTGVKVVVIDQTGKLLEHITIYPHPPQQQWQASLTTLSHLCQKYNVNLISIGNGTASRETDKLASELIHKNPELLLQKIVISEAGASVYSASELAAKEFPDLDVTLRGAVSIARRLQDPLAELVKIDPKSIGVGQYQHDVNQHKLARSLDAVVEDCVNGVGVDLNTASISLLARISGLNETLARNIVDYRNQHGAFADRHELKKVPRLGEKAFEQAAGFLRILNGENPLDASAVHPEAYPIVKRILEKTHKSIREIIGNSEFLHTLKAKDYIDEHFGIPTVMDIITELEKPGRDPRPEFKTASFKEGVEKISDLVAGMILEGVITNVTNFGAFVDIGVHQDGLVHISELSHTFVKDPNTIVKAGMLVKVKVKEIDLQRKRITLSMRLGEQETAKPKPKPQQQTSRHQPMPIQSTLGNAFAEALARRKN